MDRPKRQYTVSERVLAANRRNLALANAVDPSIRHRMTVRRRIACYRNLLRALQARRTSPRYAPIRRGVYCVSLERSLELMGESPAEFSTHLDDWRGAIELETPLHRGQGEEQRKLAGALGQASWRRLRVLRGQARWEARRLGRCLAEAIQRAKTVTPEERAESRETGADPALGLMLDVLEIFSDTTAIHPAVQQLNQRLERLLEAWLESCTGERVSLKHFTQRAGRGLGIGERPEEALGNGLVGPGRVGESLLPAPPVSVEAPIFWQARSWDAVAENLAELRAANPSLDLETAFRIALEDFGPRQRDPSRPEVAEGYTSSLENLTRAFEAALLGPDPSGLGPAGADGASPELKALVRSAGINRQEAENERFSRERSSDPLGPEFCAGRREAHSEA